MNPQEMFSLAVWVVALSFLLLLIWRVRGRKGPGAGATGAVHDMLNEEKRRAIEIIVEGRAEATDPEHVDGTPEAGAGGKRPPR